VGSSQNAEGNARRDGAVTALRTVLEMVASGDANVDGATVAGLALALDAALTAYAAAGTGDENAAMTARGRK
jgi:hypothetical protein